MVNWVLSIKFWVNILFYEQKSTIKQFWICLMQLGAGSSVYHVTEVITDRTNTAVLPFCPRCKAKTLCDISLNLIQCNDCSRRCSGPLSLEHHHKSCSFRGKTSVCSGIKLCKECFKIINNGKHQYGYSYCNVCATTRPINQYYFMMLLRNNKPSHKHKRHVLFIF